VAIIAAISIPLFAKFREVKQASPSKSQVNRMSLASFPLTKGTYWIYQGPTKWSVVNSEKIEERMLTWKMEVVDTLQQGQNFIAVLKGHPSDLAWYEEGKERGDYLLIQKGLNQYYFAFDKLMLAILDRAKSNKSIEDLLDEDRLYIDLPLRPGKKWGDPDQVNRTDNAYCWYVQSEKRVNLNSIKGLFSHPSGTQYEMRYYTNPDHEILKFVEGVGITGFQYVHHGTVSETDLLLVEFHKGED
jgi:hypothetical protein